LGFCLIISSCVEDQNLTGSIPNLAQDTILRNFTSVQKDGFLKKYKEKTIAPSIANREASEEKDYLARANWDLAYRFEDKLKGEVTYTVPIISKGVEEFSNLVIVQKGEKVNSYIMNYIPDEEWVKNKPRRRGFGTFTGTLQLLDIDGKLFAKSEYKNGKVKKNSSINSRIAECETFFAVSYVEGCGGGICHISEITWTEYEVCNNDDQGGGDSGSGSSTPPGGIGNGGAPRPTSPADLGNPGVLDPEDIAYWLRPLKVGDDIKNPYDGMKAVATDGTIYTYDAQINGWLLPEVVILEDAGGIPHFFNWIDFDGGIISAVAFTLVRGATERTPVGQVVVGTVLFHLWLYSIYEVSQIDKAVPLSVCIQKFVTCQGLKGLRPWMNCDDCLQNCRVQGNWNDTWCPL
jgi:hypothetical protein